MIAIQSGYFCPQLGLDASATLFSCVIQLIHPAGNWHIIDHLFLSFPFLFLLFFLMQIPLHLGLYPPDLLFSFNISVSCRGEASCVRFNSQFYPSTRALVPTTCNCIVGIVPVKSGDDDIHVVVVCNLTPGDDWSVVVSFIASA